MVLRDCDSDIERSILEEQYSVVAVESDGLLVRGILSGKMLTIINSPEVPLTQKDYPPGTLIALTDPSTAPLNYVCQFLPICKRFERFETLRNVFELFQTEQLWTSPILRKAHHLCR
jgi:hypothetical protein